MIREYSLYDFISLRNFEACFICQHIVYISSYLVYTRKEKNIALLLLSVCYIRQLSKAGKS